MQLHTLQPKTERIRSRQVGRGGKRGKTSGRGTKGQKARAGRKIRPEIRDVFMKLPKLRGHASPRLSKEVVIVNISQIEAVFSSESLVNPASLREIGLIEARAGKLPKVKILGDGELSKKIVIESCAVSSSARAKIEKAGGAVR